jgi:hypothetical protein
MSARLTRGKRGLICHVRYQIRVASSKLIVKVKVKGLSWV